MKKHEPQLDSDERLERYLELCKRIYERMQRENSLPWTNGGLNVD